MSELREVFEMVKQQTQPDTDSWAEQERRIRRAGRNRKIGAFALVAAIAVAAFVFVMYDPGDDQGTAVPATEPESPAPVVESGFAQYDLDTGELTFTGIVASSSAVDVSPDGTMIAYVGSPSGTSDTVHVANVDGSNVQEFARTNLAGEAKAPRWSPDGTKIVYQGKATSEEEIGNLYVLDVTTGRSERITDLQPMAAGLWWMAPTFSADGQTVFFNKPRLAGIGTSDAGQHWDIWSVPASGGEPTLIRRDAFMADLSPNGNSLAYLEAKSGDGGFETGGLYMARPDGTDAGKLANGPADSPRWSPDGTRIAYSGDVDGIHIIDVETGETQRYPDAVGWSDWVDADTLMIEVGVD